MSKSFLGLALITTLAAAGCASQTKLLDEFQPLAVQTAETRGKFQMSCPEAAASVLSREMVQPAFPRAVQRAEYTVGLSGCGKRSVIVVICPEGGSGCFTTDPGGFTRE